jgi:hypothetical protein
MIHNKECIFTLLDDLRLYEDAFLKIMPKLREHFLHSASVYVLGLAIYNNCAPLREALKRKRHKKDDENKQKSSFLFRWPLAACLHDIAYPLELSLKSFNQFSKKMHEIDDNSNYSFVKISSDIYEKLNLLPIIRRNLELTEIQKDTLLGLIANHLTNMDESRLSNTTLLNIIERKLCNDLNSGRIDHGVFSALILLKRVHELYENSEYDIKDYYFKVVDSATAIFLHNFYKYSSLKDIYGQGKFRYDFPNALGYLLFLTDTMCEWCREREINTYLFKLDVSDTRVDFILHKDYKANIQSSIEMFDDRLPINIEFVDIPKKK